MLAEEINDIVSSSKETKRSFLMAEAADDGVRQAIKAFDGTSDSGAQGASSAEDDSTGTSDPKTSGPRISDPIRLAVPELSALQRRSSYVVTAFDQDMTDDTYRQIGLRDWEVREIVMESMSDDTWTYIAEHLRVQKLVTKITLAVIDVSTGFSKRLADSMSDVDSSSDLSSQSMTSLAKQSSQVSERRRQPTPDTERSVPADPPGRRDDGDTSHEPITIHINTSAVTCVTDRLAEQPTASSQETWQTFPTSRWSKP